MYDLPAHAFLPDVPVKEQTVSAHIFYILLCHFRIASLIQISDCDICPLFDKSDRCRPADPAVPACDQGSLASELPAPPVTRIVKYRERLHP